MRRVNSLKRLWCWEGLRAGGEGDNRGWDGWMVPLTQWAWVWVNSDQRFLGALQSKVIPPFIQSSVRACFFPWDTVIPWGAQTEDSNVAHSATIPCLLQHDYKSTTIREVPHRKPPPPILPCSVLSFSCTLIPCHSFFTLHISLPFPETSTFIFLSTRSFSPILEHVILYPIKLRKWKHTHTHTHTPFPFIPFLLRNLFIFELCFGGKEFQNVFSSSSV